MSIGIIVTTGLGVLLFLLVMSLVIYAIAKRWKESGDGQESRGQSWNWGKTFKRLWWAILLAAVVWGIQAYIRGGIHENERLRAREAELARALHEEKTQIKAQKVLVASWVTEDGNAIQGKSRSGPMRAVVNEQTETSVWIKVHYEEYGTHQISWVSMKRDSDDMWRGTWEQNKPRRGGSVSMKMYGPDYWSGTMLDAVGNRYVYEIKPVM